MRLLISVHCLRKLALVHINISETRKRARVVRSDLRGELILLFGFVVARLRSTASCIGSGDDRILLADRRFFVGLTRPPPVAPPAQT